jgi:hypothetical protein
MSPRAVLTKMWVEGGPALFGFVIVVCLMLGSLIVGFL